MAMELLNINFPSVSLYPCNLNTFRSILLTEGLKFPVYHKNKWLLSKDSIEVRSC
jgi:hypothetical protein